MNRMNGLSTIKPVFLEWFKWFANLKSTSCENYEKKNYFTSYQTIWGNPVSMIRENYGRRIFTQYRTRIQDKEVIWFLWQCQTINNYSYCLSLSMVFI